MTSERTVWTDCGLIEAGSEETSMIRADDKITT